jgi:hypothetical protein
MLNPEDEQLATICVELLGEGIRCWRPVRAQRLSLDVYRIVETVPEHETWAFQPGEVVRGKSQLLGDGVALIACASVMPE